MCNKKKQIKKRGGNKNPLSAIAQRGSKKFRDKTIA
jgi:hypothetical protein